ncbi:MAG: c-type cytochrome [Nitrospinota bacterium]
MSRGMGVGIAVIGVVALTALVVSLVQGIPSPQNEYRPTATAGRAVFLEACSGCHGVEGQGTSIAPPLKGRNIPPERIRKRVQTGSGRMPRFPNIAGEAMKNLAEVVSAL